MSRLQLYYVNADSPDGSPHGNDLFVYAHDPQGAVFYWRDYYQTTDDPQSVVEVPKRTKAGPVPWQDVPKVWLAKDAI